MHPLFELLHAPLHLPARHTEDLAPFIPWFGTVLSGIFIMHHGWIQCIVLPQIKLIENIAWMGRHALAIYLVHQPLLFGALGTFSYFTASV